ncbi:MAG: PEGA domain-containing protein [Spirochaetia bacterium]
MRCILIFCLCAASFYSCVSSAGTTAAAPAVVPTDDSVATVEIQDISNLGAGLYIETDPPYAKVYLNNDFYDNTPMRDTDLDYGVYFLTIKKDGYYPYSAWITYSAKQRYYKISLKPIRGTLSLQVTPQNAVIELGGRRIPQGDSSVAAGSYMLRVRAFGYSDFSRKVHISGDQKTALVIDLKPAAQSISHLSAHKQVFNPHNPGVLGQINISFAVSKSGTGRAVISDQAGKPVYTHTFSPFTTWNQKFSWNGKNEQGEIVPNGEYRVTISLPAGNGSAAVSGETTIRVDSSYDIRYRNLWSGASGLLYAPTLDILPLGSVQLQSLIGVHFNPWAAESDLKAPVVLGTRVGLPLDSELDGSIKFIVKDFDLNPLFAASAAYTIRLIKTETAPRFRLGAQAKLAYQHEYSLDTFTDFSGGSLGVPMQLDIGPLSFVLSAEIIFSWHDISYSEIRGGNYGFYSWVYGRAGIFYDTTYLLCGLSFSARSAPFSEGFSIALPFQAAFELNALIPDSPVYISGIAAMEFNDINDFYLLTGFGLGILW